MTKAAAAAARPYRSTHRQLQAASTRAAILDAAAQLFAERGWVATGMRDVALAASAAVETVYANFGSKSHLLQAALDVAVAGDPAPIPLAERPEFAALGHGPLWQRARAAARLVSGIHQRTLGIHNALREAAASDPALAATLRADEERRRASVEQGASLVAGRRVTPIERDGLWAVLSIEVYRLLVELAGWSPRRYENWLATVIIRLLQEDGRKPS